MTGNENWDVWGDLNGSSSLTTRYLRGNVIDQIFARLDGGDASWLLTDRLGSVRDVLDDGGGLVSHLDYDAFGNVVNETGPTYSGRYGWTGRERDVEIKLQYNRARYYDPGTGRWMGEDPLGFGAGDSNLFRYVNNKATATTDPSGKLVWFVPAIPFGWKKVVWIGGAIGVAIGLSGCGGKTPAPPTPPPGPEVITQPDPRVPLLWQTETLLGKVKQGTVIEKQLSFQNTRAPEVYHEGNVERAIWEINWTLKGIEKEGAVFQHVVIDSFAKNGDGAVVENEHYDYFEGWEVTISDHKPQFHYKKTLGIQGPPNDTSRTRFRTLGEGYLDIRSFSAVQAARFT